MSGALTSRLTLPIIGGLTPSDREKIMTAEAKDRTAQSWEHAARLGQELEYQGDVRGRGDLVIEGRLRGQVRLPESDVFIAEAARVEAEILARNITVRGEVIGNITASGRAVIETTGRLEGDLAAAMISVEDGARFKGSVRILNRA